MCARLARDALSQRRLSSATTQDCNRLPRTPINTSSIVVVDLWLTGPTNPSRSVESGVTYRPLLQVLQSTFAMLRSAHLPDGPCQASAYPCPDSSWPRATLASLPSSPSVPSCARDLPSAAHHLASSPLPCLRTGVPSWFPTLLGNGAVDL
jgi:hypothetical protein